MTTHAALRRLALLLLMFWCVLAPACADTAVSLYQSYRGTVNFTGTAETLRKKDNAKACQLVNNNKGISASLAGIPSGATVLSAQLYWAGSGTKADYTVDFDGISTTAPTARQYTSKTSGGGLTYFSGAADVTTQVKKKGNGTYTFGDLDVNNDDPWCASQAVLGGFALVVIYEQKDEPFRMLNLYEGFQYFRNNSLKISLGNFSVPNPLPDKVTGRVGHVTWEGDATLQQGGENLWFNDTTLTDAMNPTGNQFNSASNVTGDATTYGIDFDIYTLKSPIIQPGQNAATTTYESGQDLVLLGAEIVAMPYVANADLSLSMTRTGDLRVGATASYTITVTNNGIDAEVGPVTVVDTLPAGLKLVSATGSGWTCTSAAGSNSQTIVTCVQSGPVASGAKMSAITLSVSPSAIGNYTNTATVSGKTGDNAASNNTATNTSSATDSGSAALVFTKEACSVGQAIVMSPDEAGCHRFIGPVVAADSSTRIYITSVGGANKASAFSASKDIALDLMASCLPYSGAGVTYGSKALDCKGTWTAATLTFPANTPSVSPGSSPAFFYADVGRISMSMRFNNVVMGTVDFISRPFDIRFKDVLRSDGVSDLNGTSPAWSKPDDFAFTTAGDAFTLRLGALMANGFFAPSFGKEQAVLTDVADFEFKLDKFTVDPAASPVLPLAEKDVTVQDAFVLDANFARSSADATLYDARARWYEAGYLALTPYLVDYLGTGQVGGPPAQVAAGAQARLVASTRVIGRFYPDHFETGLTAPFFCLAPMKCPETAADSVEGAAYSLQPFNLQVTAYGLPRNSQPAPLSLFRHVAARKIGLGVFRKPTETLAPAGGPFTFAALPLSTGPADYPALKGTASYKLGAPFSGAKRHDQDWGVPTAIYLRASMPERIQVSGGSAKDIVVTSFAGAAPAAGVRYEDGLMVVAGRLLVQNVFGSELLRLPVPLAAQYWTGTAWLTNTNDSESTVASTLTLAKCSGTFAASAAGDCKTGQVSLSSAGTPIALSKGIGTLTLLAPGRDKTGSVEFSVGGGAAAAWLPSTTSRVNFRLYTSPVIYLREVY
jgi:uncharacterized repeat protein (TIGR01451 family)